MTFPTSGSRWGRSTSSEPETQSQEQRTKNAQPNCPCYQQPMILIARSLPDWKRGALWQRMQSRAPPHQPQGASKALTEHHISAPFINLMGSPRGADLQHEFDSHDLLS